MSKGIRRLQLKLLGFRLITRKAETTGRRGDDQERRRPRKDGEQERRRAGETTSGRDDEQESRQEQLHSALAVIGVSDHYIVAMLLPNIEMGT